MSLIKRLFVVFFLILLSGCSYVSYGELKRSDPETTPKLNYLPIGIPYLMGGHGTSIPITPHLSLTAAHVASVSYNEKVAVHPYCDVAIIESDNSDADLLELGLVHSQEPVSFLGYGLSGQVIQGAGKYYLDATFVDAKLFERCPASVTDAANQSGMSGGAVLNAEGELVGIISGLTRTRFKLLDDSGFELERASVFVSVNYVFDWLNQSVYDYYLKKDGFNAASESLLTLNGKPSSAELIVKK